MSKYKIETPAKSYNDTFLGVKFTKGIGYTDKEETASRMKNFNYNVTEVEGAAEEVEVAPEAEEETAAEVALDELTSDELKSIAKEKGLTGYSKLKKADLIEAIKGAE